MKHESFQSPEVSPAQEILSANQKIEDMIGQTDINPEHLEQAVTEARAVYEKYENVEGDEDFDVALDVLLNTIENTKLLEEDVQKEFSEKIGGVKGSRDAA